MDIVSSSYGAKNNARRQPLYGYEALMSFR